jgi:hypothetical protein
MRSLKFLCIKYLVKFKKKIPAVYLNAKRETSAALRTNFQAYAACPEIVYLFPFQWKREVSDYWFNIAYTDA